MDLKRAMLDYIANNIPCIDADMTKCPMYDACYGGKCYAGPCTLAIMDALKPSYEDAYIDGRLSQKKEIATKLEALANELRMGGRI